MPASEHSIMTTHTAFRSDASDDPDELFKTEVEAVRFLMKKFPTGILSVVFDSTDYWRMITEGLPILKDEIMARDGKLVCRPDSGSPVKIICGYKSRSVSCDSETAVKLMKHVSTHMKWFTNNDAIFCDDGVYLDSQGNELTEAEVSGSIQLLSEIFGCTKNDKGYKELDYHIGS